MSSDVKSHSPYPKYRADTFQHYQDLNLGDQGATEHVTNCYMLQLNQVVLPEVLISF